CWYLSKLYKEFNDLDLVIAAYNGGSGNVNKWLNDEAYSKDGNKLHEIPFNETKNYLGKVKENYIIYKSLYGEEEANEKN
ncbi:transglycosylase SLT domain-containing protein, partial [Alistipes putredinis]|nr:transglycosylase SLT domain-containing protein [Alistipes putredinis]